GRTGSPGDSVSGSREDHRELAAAAEPGRFEGVGSHSQEQPAKPAKQTRNRGGLDAEADLWGQGSRQHVRDEQAPLEPSEIVSGVRGRRGGSASAGPLFHMWRTRLGSENQPRQSPSSLSSVTGKPR